MSGSGNPVTLATSGSNTIPAESYADSFGNKMFGNVMHSVDGSGVAQPASSTKPVPVVDSAAATALGLLATAAGQASVLTQATATASGIGTSNDGAWSGTGPASLVAALKGIFGKLAGTLTTKRATATATAVATASITAGGTYQQAFAAGLANGVYFVNTDSTGTGETLWVDPTGATGTTLGNAAVPVPPGGLYELPFTPTAAVTVYAATAGHTFHAAGY